jgi:hypothetical protein
MTQTYLFLLKEAMWNYGWVPTDRYANLFRTSIPTAMTLIGLARKADTSRTLAIMQDRWWRMLLYQWPLRSMWGQVHYRFIQVHKPLVEFLQFTTDAAAKKLARCAKSLQQRLSRKSGIEVDLDPLKPEYETKFTNRFDK